ncbi:H-NS histone family protein (plasmid) [Paraburkholderia sp. PREW-6R]|uniref:H-NS histone family protein n=1 Tax=Paraburkholderia sp. PREW-6R TaxID=3141544 RepID=UPI0031F537C0
MERNTYSKLVRQLAELDSEIERVRRLERCRVIAEIRSQMQEFGIKPSELVGRKRGRSSAPARYLNPETGQTWTGRGARPHWLVGKESKEFLIVPQESHRSGEEESVKN